MNEDKFQYTNNWFGWGAKKAWDDLIPRIKPTRILEIGSFEGKSACYLIETLGAKSDIEIHCIDTWEGGIEHQAGGVSESDMNAVEKRFHHNTQLAMRQCTNKITLVTHKGLSDSQLTKLLHDGKQGYFDFIYIDGSHQAPDVLSDAVLGFKLLKVQGVMAFDDYLWQESFTQKADPIACPKIAIDAFTNIYCHKLRVLAAPLYQLYIRKTSD